MGGLEGTGICPGTVTSCKYIFDIVMQCFFVVNVFFGFSMGAMAILCYFIVSEILVGLWSVVR